MLGEGIDNLLNWYKACNDSGGKPILITEKTKIIKNPDGSIKRKRKIEFKDRIIVKCYGASRYIPGGTINGLNEIQIESIRQKKKMDE